MQITFIKDPGVLLSLIFTNNKQVINKLPSMILSIFGWSLIISFNKLIWNNNFGFQIYINFIYISGFTFDVYYFKHNKCLIMYKNGILIKEEYNPQLKDFIHLYISNRTWFQLSIQSEEEENDACLYFSLIGFTLRLRLPNFILKPYKDQWDFKHSVIYGINIFDNFISIYYGPCTHDSITTKHKGWFMPWADHRFIRTSLYYPDLTMYEYNVDKMDFDVRKKKELECSKRFSFKDYDGEDNIATVFIVQREWQLGTKWCRWLSYIVKPLIRTNIDISFDKGIGNKKNSWKGGILGTGHEIKFGESIESAFNDFGKKHNFTDIV